MANEKKVFWVEKNVLLFLVFNCIFEEIFWFIIYLYLLLGQYEIIDIRFSGDFDISFIIYMIVNNNVQGEKKDLALIRVVDRINKCDLSLKNPH